MSKLCEARTRVTRQPCTCPAVEGSRYCGRHQRYHNNHARLPNFYNTVLGPTLKKRMQEALEAPHYAQVQLYEELAISRSLAQEGIALASAALESTNEDTKALAITVAQSALNHVRDMVTAVARIEQCTVKDKVPISAINIFIQQVMAAINTACNGDIELAKRIEDVIEQNVKVPMCDEDESAGTSRTPDQIVTEMDNTVVC